jgi:hypothetical protein
MSDLLPPTDATPAGTAVPSGGLFRRPAVLAGLLFYFLAVGAAAVHLSRSGPAPLPQAAFPSYEVDPAWVSAVFPQIHRDSPRFAETRFRDRVDELRWRAELYERQKHWRKAKACYDEIAVLIRAESHPVTRYIRERTRILAALERS